MLLFREFIVILVIALSATGVRVGYDWFDEKESVENGNGGPNNNESSSSELCSDCSKLKCPSPGHCFSGMVRDQCGCCDVCGLEEGQLCNTDDIELQPGKTWYGRCGYFLECRMREDTMTNPSLHQYTCQCINAGPVCGTDGQTYFSFCRLNAVKVRSNGTISSAHEGPCSVAPKFLNKIGTLQAIEGKDITISCEIEAYPVPEVKWDFMHLGSTVQNLPNDDSDVSISTRGGPRPLQVSSYLQITNIKRKHEGIYHCMGFNSVGNNSQEFSVVVLPNGVLDRKANEF